MEKFSKHIVTASLLIVGIIHVLPLVGVLGAERLTMLYGIPIDEPNLEILMRHRAVLFGILGFTFLYAAFRPKFQLFAFIAGFISINSFLWLVQATGDFNEQVQGVFFADVVALASLIVGAIAWFIGRKAPGAELPR